VRDILRAESTSGEVRKRIFRLIKNGLALGFILVFFNLLKPELISLIDYAFGGLSISGDLILSVITLLFVVYFGYFILVDVKYFLDLATTQFGQKGQANLKSITYDVAGLISLVLASFLLTPIVTAIQGVGETAVKVVNIVLLAIGLFVVYHLANQIYSLFKREIGKLILGTKQFRASHNTKKTEEQPK
jgi:hypothetical protein